MSIDSTAFYRARISYSYPKVACAHTSLESPLLGQYRIASRGILAKALFIGLHGLFIHLLHVIALYVAYVNLQFLTCLYWFAYRHVYAYLSIYFDHRHKAVSFVNSLTQCKVFKERLFRVLRIRARLAPCLRGLRPRFIVACPLNSYYYIHNSEKCKFV